MTLANLPQNGPLWVAIDSGSHPSPLNSFMLLERMAGSSISSKPFLVWVRDAQRPHDKESMMIELREVGPTLTEAGLASFELELGATLPDPYRRFLLRNNGGRPPIKKDTVDVEGLPGGAAGVQFFFGRSDSLKSYDLRWNKETLGERIPDNLLPIACDSSGNDFCLSLQGADRGAVLYCDLQSVYCNFEADPDFYPVAPDFDSFLNKLREFPDEEPTGADKG